MVSKEVEIQVLEFYTELATLSELYEELTDTDVRESLHLTLNYCFVWGNTLEHYPMSYGMFSLAGDRELASATKRFLIKLTQIPEVADLPLGRERLAVLQNPSLVTASGYQYDDFIGHAEEPLSPTTLPDDLFEPGIY